MSTCAYHAIDLQPCLSAPDSSWLHALGTYYPRQHPQHWNSAWTQAVLQAKRHSDSVLAEFGRIVAEHLDQWLADERPYTITHVPSMAGEIRYLFPQMEVCTTRRLAIATFRCIRRREPLSLTQLLVQVKRKAKKQRRWCSRRERLNNVRGCYGIRHGTAVAGRNVLLIDDVVTSGATLNECARVLQGAGARNVFAIALARTPGWH